VSTVSKCIKGKQLPAHSVTLEMYSGIALFLCDITAPFPRR